MKCGRKIEDQKVFCADCLTEMEKFPVAPDTAVHIPVRPTVAATKKKNRRARDLKPEEQIRRLRVAVRSLSIAVVILLVVLALSAGLLLKMIGSQDSSHTIGQNYGTITGSTD